ncbi:HNH endonuclease [Mycolicibacterium smegmatis]|nr:HNH endonuclease [Mycolicibacterium smegmatis]CKH13421.1 Uncharacterised protein [Mycolicibacterium smegmatis]
MAWKVDAPGSCISRRTKTIVMKRDRGECQLGYEGCDVTVGIEFDHIVSVKAMKIARVNADDPELIQLACVPCHRKKGSSHLTV